MLITINECLLLFTLTYIMLCIDISLFLISFIFT
ncbi:hypothetical protein BCI_0437 [Baumannia cicadellinicola str. Hc (Homalodisca coagulata)]|uniref:Uncharacterized protein n=1 Tax=Baumannia cicadellinicola subsp. Homalodisca coagulata TaxID=374463 RepID=Q1LT36_BAUCH|nr:hypothetical protein BCI_0437 [Baumannia cicadellinicola str. Hc (Homalodisca coagulata)]